MYCTVPEKVYFWVVLFFFLFLSCLRFLTTAKPITREEAVQQVIQSVREFVGPVAAFKTAVIVPSLPKTRSGKTVRGVLSKILHGKPYRITPTMENPHVLEDIEEIVREEGIIERTLKH